MLKPRVQEGVPERPESSVPPEEAAKQEANPQLQPQPSRWPERGERERGGQDPRGIGRNLLQDLQVRRGLRVEDLPRQKHRAQGVRGHQGQEQRVPPAGMLLCRSFGQPGPAEGHSASHQNPLHLPGGQRGGGVRLVVPGPRRISRFLWCGGSWKEPGVSE